MQVIRAAEAPRFQLPGLEFTGLAAPSRGSGKVCTWKLTVDPGVRGDTAHTLDSDEVFMVLSGSVQITPEGAALGAGDAAAVPAGEGISITNLGETPAEIHVVINAGFTATMPDGSTLQPPWAQ
jgi:mannose-6-phosphate isomerase-like protein (cupin superfamily)